MKVTFLGGAGEYGRSCFLLTIRNYNLLIDCGVLKSGKTAAEQYPALTPELARTIDAVFITHAHEDHTGALPYLVSLGYSGGVYAAEETIEQANYYLNVWRETQMDRMGAVPYSLKDEEQIHFRPIEEWERNQLPGLSFNYGKNGHLIGSLWFLFSDGAASAYFSGDFTMESEILAFSYPKVESRPAIAVMDGAYGIESRKQQMFKEQILEIVENAKQTKTSVLMPLPPYGRSQDILYLLRCFLTDSSFSVRVGPAILEASMHYAESIGWFKPGVDKLFRKLIKTIVARQAEPQDNRPILAFYSESELLKNPWWLEEESMHIIFTGPVSRQLKEIIHARPKAVHTFDEVRYKVHPGIYELEKLLHVLKPEHTVLTHSSAEDALPLARELEKRTGLRVEGGVAVPSCR